MSKTTYRLEELSKAQVAALFSVLLITDKRRVAGVDLLGSVLDQFPSTSEETIQVFNAWMRDFNALTAETGAEIERIVSGDYEASNDN